MKLRTEDGEVRLSQSAMEAFFQCPARLKYMTEWETTEPFEALVDGNKAHEILAGKEVPDASARAVQYAESLWDMARANNIELWGQEFEQVFPLEEGIWFKRIIDGIGSWNGEPVIIDWKTSGKGPWPKFRKSRRASVVPKAMGFQAVSYLVPPTEQAELDRFGLSAWPEMMLFLVSDPFGNGEIAVYNRDMEMEANFRSAAQLMAHAIRWGNFPHIRGGACGIPGTSWACSYVDLCYQCAGWEEKYRRLG